MRPPGALLALAAAVLFALAVLAGAPAAAFTPLDGTFEASRDCPALQSFRKGTNPGAVRLEPGRGYALLGANRLPASHYRLRVPGAAPPERWVAADCGHPAGGEEETPEAAGGEGLPPGAYVLAISWHPAFCELSPDARECRTQAPRLVLHGLWRDGAADTFCRGERPDLSPALARRLSAVMPGTAARLHHHQWRKHGSCFGLPPERYFAIAVDLIETVTASPVAAVIAGKVGDTLTRAQAQAAFDAAFGAGAGRRVSLSCVSDGDGRRLFREFRIRFAGPLAAGEALAGRIRAARPVRGGCPAGLVDRPGPS